MELVERLFDGPLDIVGDVHGEYDAMMKLMATLGYDKDGRHPYGRHLVFVGDLVDRGPDSVAVLRKVRELVLSGRALCVLGNHELNLLLGKEKPDNLWFTNPDKESEHPATVIGEYERAKMLEFLESLPLVLERDDLRIVHACWNTEAIYELRKARFDDGCLVSLFSGYENAIYDEIEASGLADRCVAEKKVYAKAVKDPEWEPKLLPAKAEIDERLTMENPIKVVTSGEERITSEPFWAGGKWRMVDRVTWWDDYEDDVPVIFGHYWRRFGEASKVIPGFGPDIFPNDDPGRWFGKRNNVYCIDFSVGARPSLRAGKKNVNAGRLSALRFPECELVHDDGERLVVMPPGDVASVRASVH